MEEQKQNISINVLNVPIKQENDVQDLDQTIKDDVKQEYEYEAEYANNQLNSLRGNKTIVLEEKMKVGDDQIVNGLIHESNYLQNLKQEREDDNNLEVQDEKIKIEAIEAVTNVIEQLIQSNNQNDQEYEANHSNKLFNNLKDNKKRAHSEIIKIEAGKEEDELMIQSKYRNQQEQEVENVNNLINNFTDKKTIIFNEQKRRNGSAEIVNEFMIKSKYCKTAQATVNSCFQGRQFKYPDQQIEVPPEQFDQVKRLFELKEMKDVKIRKGQVRYSVAKNIAKSGTIEGLTYDRTEGIQLGANVFGLSSVLTYAFTLWNGGSSEECILESLNIASSIFGVSVISNLLSQQFAKSSLNKFAHESTLKILNKVLNQNQFAAFANSFRGQGAQNIYGATVQQSAAKMVKGQAVFAVGILAMQTGWDVIQVINGKISGKQLTKNFLSNAGSGVGGIAGAIYGTCIGGPIGGILGGIIGGLASGFIVKKIADQVTPDDLEEMATILQKVISDLQQKKFMLSKVEFEAIMTEIQKELSNNNDFLQNMFESADKEKYAIIMLKPKFKFALQNRRYVMAISEIQNFFFQIQIDN